MSLLLGHIFLPVSSAPVALQRRIPGADRGDEQAEAEQGTDSFRSLLRVVLSRGPSLTVPFRGRSSRPTGRKGARCWCPARTSSCWSSASGTSPCHEKGPTSTSSGLTSSGWVTVQAVPGHWSLHTWAGPFWIKMESWLFSLKIRFSIRIFLVRLQKTMN